MKLFQFFIVENFMVAGLPLCEKSSNPDDRNRVFIPQCDLNDLIPFGYHPSRNLFEPAPPKANEVKERPIQGKPSQPGAGQAPGISCKTCPRGKKWTNYMSIDSNDGTGDHERFM